MIIGNITTKDIITKSPRFIKEFGFFRYVYFLYKALSPKVSRFVDLLFK